MADVRQAWNDTGERVNALGLKLKMHYEQQRGAEGERERAEIAEAVKHLAEAVQDAFEALGTAAKDQAVKDDVKQVGQSLTDALATTFSEVSGDLKKAFKRPSS